MKIQVFCIYFFILSTGCSSLTRTDECRKYYDFLEEGWQRKDDGFFGFVKKPSYTDRMSSLSQSVNTECLIGLKKRDIKKLFGQPTLEEATEFHYFTNANCYNEDKTGCGRLRIVFDGETERVRLVRPFDFEGPGEIGKVEN